MRKILLIILLIIMTTGTKSQSLEVLFDNAVFKYSADSSLVEIYYSMLDTALTYEKNEKSQLVSKVHFQAYITHLQKNTKENYQWEFKQYKSLEDEDLIYSLFGVEQIFLPRGEYKIEIIASDDKNPKSKFSSTFNLNVFAISGEKPQISMIELAAIAETKSEKSREWDHMFQKGDMYVIPNPPLEFSSDNPNLKFYFETYNSHNKKLQYQVSILDGAKREAFKTFLPVWDAKDHGRILSVPLDFLPTGVYYLQLNLADYSNPPALLDEVTKKFYFYNQFVAPRLTANFTEDQLFEMSEFATMNMTKVDYEFRKARSIAGSVEASQWEKLKELPGKQRFLYRFWAMRDEDTTTILNEFKAEFDDRVEYANTYFSFGKNKDGWNTDRGRVLLKYGVPTQIDRHAQSGTDRPYEEWFYAEVQGGVDFHFVDVMGFGNYIQVNSTATGEIRNPRWFQDYVQNQKGPQDEMQDQYR